MSKLGDEVKADCPSCGKGKWAIIRAVVEQHEDEGGVWMNKSHRVLQCPACKGYVHQTDFVFSEDTNDYIDDDGEWNQDYVHTIEQWPSLSAFEKAPPVWLDEVAIVDRVLYELLKDTYTAIEHDLRVFAAVGIRTTFDRASELLKIDINLPFAKKLEELASKQHISIVEKDQLSIAADAGSAAAHRGWSPSPEELKIALDVIEAFIYRMLILPEQAERLKKAIPKRGEAK